MPRPITQSLPVRVVRTLSEGVLAAIVASYALIICVQVFYRYALNDSITWSEEVVRFGLLWGVMIGSGIAADRGAHVALDPLRSLLKNPLHFRIVSWIAGLCVILFCALLGYYSWMYLTRLWNMTSPAAQIPMRYVFFSVPVGMALTSFFVLVHLIAGDSRSADPLETELMS